ncbi:MAG: DNA modification methylase [Paracoccaceae bacterium]
MIIEVDRPEETPRGRFAFLKSDNSDQTQPRLFSRAWYFGVCIPHTLRIFMDLVFTPSEIETWPIEKLRPYARNAKIHGDDQVAKIAASMAKFGWTVPCMVADDGELIAGHGRVLAATMLGLKEVPVIRLGHLGEAERRAYRIADNKLTEMGDWDDAVLRDEIAGLLAEDFDLSLLGITDEDLDALLQDPDVGDGAIEGEDDIPETPEDAVSRPGDLWVLENHRLLCGDSTVATDVERVLGSVKPLLMVTDPPYGVEYDPGWRNKTGASATKRTGKVLNDDRADWREAWALFPGDVAYVWHGALHAATVAESLMAAGFNVRSQIIWAKDRLVLSRGDYHWQHEPCWYAVKKTGKGHWVGDRKQTTLWQISKKDQDADTVHGTQKPVECMRRPMLNNSNPGQTIYEPFMGSGTTLIAAETTGRVCHGIELNPAYIDVAVQRWQQFTGQDAVLDGTDQTFAELADNPR